MNYNNLAQKTNYIAGSDKFEQLPFYLTNVNIPGINFSHPAIGGRGSAKLNVGGDTLTYNTLSFEMLIDEDFTIYTEFMNKVIENISVENATFADNTFDFWIQINNNKGNKIMKMEFFNCRVESIGDIQLDTQDDMTEHLMNVEIKYDYFEVVNNDSIPTLRT